MGSIWDIVGKVFKSKTLIVNWAALVAATLTLWTNSELVAQYPDIAGALVAALAGVNLVLRWVTTLPLSDK